MERRCGAYFAMARRWPTIALLLSAPVLGTKPRACGAACGEIFADLPHNGSCAAGRWPGGFTVQPHFHVR